MATIRYTAPGWPSGQPGHAAFTPHFTRLAGGGAQQYKDGLNGHPGTLAIPAPGPGVEQGTAGQAQMGLSRTRDCPPVFYPSQYWAQPQGQYWPGAGMPVSVASDNLMPIPAADPRGIPSTQFVPVNQRGQAQIASAPTMPQWPWVNRAA